MDVSGLGLCHSIRELNGNHTNETELTYCSGPEQRLSQTLSRYGRNNNTVILTTEPRAQMNVGRFGSGIMQSLELFR